jgi:hypothetical protein
VKRIVSNHFFKGEILALMRVFLSSFFRKKKQKIAACEALAEFLTQKPSENQAAAAHLPTRASWFSSAQRAAAGFSVRNSPARIIFSMI